MASRSAAVAGGSTGAQGTLRRAVMRWTPVPNVGGMALRSWAGWCFRHKWSVILLWLMVLLGTGMGGGALGEKYADVLDLPDTDSSRAVALLQEAFPDQAGESDTVVWQVPSGSVRDAAVREEILTLLDEIGRQPDVGAVISPYTGATAAQISRDGRTAYATVTFTKPAGEIGVDHMKGLVEAVDEAGREGLAVEVGGPSVVLAEAPPARLSEVVGVLAAAVVLLIAFGSFFGMLLPILTTLFAVGTAISGIGLLSHVTTVPQVSTMLAALVGLGVGIDYALFIVTRHRKGLLGGLPPERAVVRAVDTSGRAVIFAGGTVCVALLGMFVLGMTFLNGVAVAAALTVATTVLAAVTLLPALLGVLGMRVLSRRQRRRLATGTGAGAEGATRPTAAARWAGVLERRPRLLGAVALVLMAALTLPAFSLRLGTSDQGNNPTSSTTRQAYDMLAEGFGPGFNGPLLLAAEVPTRDDSAALDGLVSRIGTTEGVAEAVRTAGSGDGRIAMVRVVPTTSPQDERTDRLIETLREKLIPQAEQGRTLQVHVGGATAVGTDFAVTLLGKLPLFIGVIVLLGCLLLLIAFRSLVVPLTAAVMNLLAAAASFGVLVAVFQWGWGGELLAAGRPGPIEAFLPVIMLSLLFGLSMDYQVFLVSRMHEEWVHSADNARAVRVGVTETSRVITAAGVIMICVFSAFVLSGQRAAAMFGLGLAGAVALDAFVLRTVLVPALMHLLGRTNWWLPGWLDRRLPHVAVDPPDDPAPTVFENGTKAPPAAAEPGALTR